MRFDVQFHLYRYIFLFELFVSYVFHVLHICFTNVSYMIHSWFIFVSYTYIFTYVSYVIDVSYMFHICLIYVSHTFNIVCVPIRYICTMICMFVYLASGILSSGLLQRRTLESR